MKAGAAGGHSTSMACAGHCAAWLFSLAALIVAAVPEYARWSLFLFALALLHWAWLVYGGHRRRAGLGADGRSAALATGQTLHDLLVESSRTAGNDLRALRADLKQVRGLVHDAVVTLGDGFQGIHARIQIEGEIIATVMARLLGGMEIGTNGGDGHGAAVSTRSLLRDLHKVFQTHIDSLSAVARCRDEVIQRLDELTTQIDAAVRYCGAAGADALIAQRLEETRAALFEVRRLTGEVVARDLTAAISTKRGVDTLLAESTELNHQLSDMLVRAASAGTGVNHSLDVLVRSLQFEDVVRQLLEYCDRQVAGIEIYVDGLTGLLAESGSESGSGRQPQEQQARLMQACESYLENSTRWASDRQRHITQTSMRAGNVELF
jgi:methyl-accepting chemotaxis protein